MIRRAALALGLVIALVACAHTWVPALAAPLHSIPASASEHASPDLQTSETTAVATSPLEALLERAPLVAQNLPARISVNHFAVLLLALFGLLLAAIEADRRRAQVELVGPDRHHLASPSAAALRAPPRLRTTAA